MTRDVLVPIQTDARQHQIGQWLADAEQTIRHSLALAEASLDASQRALEALAELREQIDGGSVVQRRQPHLRAVSCATDCKPPFSMDSWHEPAVLTIARTPQLQPASPISPRETEVLALLAGGQSNKEIAYHLSLSTRTVERHINNIYRKIGVQNRAEATAYALRRHIA